MASNPTAAPGRDLKAALKEAGFSALVTLGLCIPIIAWGTRQNMDNVLVLDPRWDAVAWAVGMPGMLDALAGLLLPPLATRGMNSKSSSMPNWRAPPSAMMMTAMPMTSDSHMLSPMYCSTMMPT